MDTSKSLIKPKRACPTSSALGMTRRKCVKKRSLHIVNEHSERTYNEVSAVSVNF